MSKKFGSRNFEDGDQYEPSDSDDGYTEAEKQLLDRTRHIDSSDHESEEEVFGIQSSDDEVEETNMDSDIEGNEEDDLPSARAWGKSKKIFYNTDYVDQDYGGFQGKDAIEADYEEQEARAIQLRLAQQLDDADFSLDLFAKEPADDKQAEKAGFEEKEQVKTDLSLLTKRQKLALFQKEAPEFTSIVEDFKAHMSELEEKLEPVLSLIKEGKVPGSPAADFIKTRYHLTLNYCTNIMFYLLLKARRVSVQSHPIIRRLVQFRQLLEQLEPLWVDTVRPQCDQLLQMVEDGQEIQSKAQKTSRIPSKKLLRLLKSPSGGENEDEESFAKDATKSVDQKSKMKKAKSNKNQLSNQVSTSFNDMSEGEENREDDDMEGDTGDQTVEAGEAEEVGKRGITYQIARNKGLTPHRKKEQRNPRVKNRNKYRKALIRRKGQVRNVRTEVERYGGELSGIKTHVKKGIKIKV